jgi:hypothetical protein
LAPLIISLAFGGGRVQEQQRRDKERKQVTGEISISNRGGVSRYQPTGMTRLTAKWANFFTLISSEVI